MTFLEGVFLIFSLIFVTLFLLEVVLPLFLSLLIRIIENWRNILLVFSDYKNKLKNLRFRYYLDGLHLFTLIIFYWIPSIDYRYFLVFYTPLWITTRLFVSIVRSIITKGKKEKISEFQFFYYIIAFIVVILAYIFSFSLFYYFAFSLNLGHFEVDNDNVKILDRIDSLLYSGFTFFAMDYEELEPKGLLRFFTFTEVIGAEIVFIMFISIMAGEVIAKLELKKNE